MKLELEHLLRPRVLVEFAGDELWDRLPWALLAIGVIIGGAFVVWLIKLLLSYIFIPKYRERYVLIREDKPKSKSGGVENNAKPTQYFAPTRRMRWGSFAHLILETFFFIAIVLVLWIGAHVAGFNFWTSSIVLGFMGTAVVYIFTAGLQNIGAGYMIFLTDKIEEGWYISVDQYKGRIIEIHPLYVEIESRDSTTGGAIHHQIPMLRMLTSVVSRFYHEEYYAPILTRKDDPTQHLLGGDQSDVLVDVGSGGVKISSVSDADYVTVLPKEREPTHRQRNGKIQHQPYPRKIKKGQ